MLRLKPAVRVIAPLDAQQNLNGYPVASTARQARGIPSRRSCRRCGRQHKKMDAYRRTRRVAKCEL